MNQNYNCVDDFVETVDAATTWQRGMADAAAARNVTIQWCYATPTDALAALRMPAVTNFRVSYDFCYGNSWDVGASSLLIWALGKQPSKDTLWTTPNNRTAIPGCDWTPDHEAPAAALHVAVALLSGGPVGVSDAIGFTNYTLLKEAIAADGTLLAASRSGVSVDSALAQRPSRPDGQIFATHCDVGGVVAHSLLGFKLNTPFSVNASEFYPPLSNATYAVTTRGRPCVDGAAAATCVRFTTADAMPVVVVRAVFNVGRRRRRGLSAETASRYYVPRTTHLVAAASLRPSPPRELRPRTIHVVAAASTRPGPPRQLPLRSSCRRRTSPTSRAARILRRR